MRCSPGFFRACGFPRFSAVIDPPVAYCCFFTYDFLRSVSPIPIIPSPYPPCVETCQPIGPACAESRVGCSLSQRRCRSEDTRLAEDVERRPIPDSVNIMVKWGLAYPFRVVGVSVPCSGGAVLNWTMRGTAMSRLRQKTIGPPSFLRFWTLDAVR